MYVYEREKGEGKISVYDKMFSIYVTMVFVLVVSLESNAEKCDLKNSTSHCVCECLSRIGGYPIDCNENTCRCSNVLSSVCSKRCTCSMDDDVEVSIECNNPSLNEVCIPQKNILCGNIPNTCYDEENVVNTRQTTNEVITPCECLKKGHVMCGTTGEISECSVPSKCKTSYPNFCLKDFDCVICGPLEESTRKCDSSTGECVCGINANGTCITKDVSDEPECPRQCINAFLPVIEKGRYAFLSELYCYSVNVTDECRGGDSDEEEIINATFFVYGEMMKLKLTEKSCEVDNLFHKSAFDISCPESKSCAAFFARELEKNMSGECNI